MSERDIKVLVTVRVYDAEPDEVLRRMRTMPADVAWYTIADGEFEIIGAELTDGGQLS